MAMTPGADLAASRPGPSTSRGGAWLRISGSSVAARRRKADETARETQPQPPSLSRSDGEPAQAPPAYRGAPFAADRPARSAGLTVASR